MRYTEENLRSYVEKCFKDAFRAENRDYNEKLWSFEWVMIKNPSGVFQLYPIMWCKFSRVLRRVEWRLQNNLLKNFGVQYENTNDMSCLFYDDGQIDFNFTKAMFQTKQGNVSLSVIDNNTNPYENDLTGKCIPAYTYEKLLFQYWNLDSESYNALSENDEKRYLPDFLRKDWNAFKFLYNETFDTPIDSYEIICSSGVKQL